MNEIEKKLSEGLQKYIPQIAIPIIVDYLVKYKVHLKITKRRVTKLGDYRPPFRGHGHRISVNHDLNSYSFLNVLIHELAHLLTFEKHQNKVKPHGWEWKNAYQELMDIFLQKQIFPEDLTTAIRDFMQNPTASSCVDTTLYKAFKKYDAPPPILPHGFKKAFLEELEEGVRFMTERGQIFTKGKKLRKRYKCQETGTGKWYVFSPVAEVYFK